MPYSHKALQTCLAIVTVLLFLYARFQAPWLLIAAIALAAACALSLRVAVLLFRLWELVTGAVRKILTWVFLSAVFYLVLVPVALLKRLFTGTDKKFHKPNQNSYYVRGESDFTRKEFYERLG